MPRSGVVIRDLRPDDVPAAIGIFTDSFLDFPVLQVVTGTDAGARDRLHSLFAMEFEPEARMSALVAEQDGLVAGALTYQEAPACSSMGAGRVLRFMRIAGPRVFSSFRLFNRIDRAHPKTSHRHLPTVGVDPALQGQGIGQRLMQAFDQRCDDDGVDAYLETVRWSDPDHPSLERFYGRLGYEVASVIPVTDAWSVLTMMRPPGKDAT